MKKFEKFNGLVAPMDRANVDTDMIIPKQFLKSIKRTGFGPNLFDEWRYLDRGEPGQDNSLRPLNEDFVLNRQEYQNAEILLARRNFGCGSSREHAPWAIQEFGFKALIAPSYADIFFNNCFKNGLLPIALTEDEVDKIFASTLSTDGYQIEIDLAAQCLYDAAGARYSFEIEEFRKRCLLEGLDDIDLTLQETDVIKQFEAKQREESPWLYDAIK